MTPMPKGEFYEPELSTDFLKLPPEPPEPRGKLWRYFWLKRPAAEARDGR